MSTDTAIARGVRLANGRPIPWSPPILLPAQWVMVQRTDDGAKYWRKDGLQVIVSADYEQDDRPWLHVSLSREGRLPSYQDMVDVKEVFCGRESYAYQVFPPRSRWINIHPFVLHVWQCLDGQAGAVLPDFARGGKTI